MRRRSRDDFRVQVLLGLLSVAVALTVLYLARTWVPARKEPTPPPAVTPRPPGPPYRAAARTFDGPSTELQATTIAPTLDEPLVAGRNVIWCASFQLAWQALRREIVKGPVHVAGAESLSDALNAVPPLDLPREACWSWAGLADGRGREAARASFLRWRPDGEPPELPVLEDGVVALAALEAAVPFARGFNVGDGPLPFRDATGRETGVRAFGLREQDSDDYWDIRKQARVAHASWAGEEGASAYEVVLDPDRTSTPYQVVLASVSPRATLAATWSYVLQRLRNPTWRGPIEGLLPADTLLVPEMAWRIVHEVGELVGPERGVAGTNLRLAAARQEITFRLDRGGAAVSSWAGLCTACGPGRYEFDRPFLVALLPRHRNTPFLVMWVDNAELLVPFEETVR